MKARRTLTAHTKRIVAARAKWRCEECGALLDEDYEIDHLVPLHLGGTDALDNLRALDGLCHRRKTLREEAARIEAQRRSNCSAHAAAFGSSTPRQALWPAPEQLC